MNLDPRHRDDGHATDHRRARELAASRLGDPLAARDAAWLTDHLEQCTACRTIAAAYVEQRALLRSFRETAPLPPRDLWARTAATIEGHGRRSTRWASRLPWAGRPLLAPAAALLVAVLVGAGLLNGVGSLPGPANQTGGSGPIPTPIAMTAGDIQFVTRGDDGVLALSTRHYDEVCPVGAPVCGTSASTDTRTLPADLAGLGSFDAYISPAQDHIVVVGRGASGGGVYVVPVAVPQTAAPSTTPSAPRTPAPTATPPTHVTPVPATPNPTAPSTPATPTPVATLAPTPTPIPTAPATPALPTPSVPPAATFSPPPDASASPPVDVTPAPGGTLEIAHGVIVVGNISGYSADGTRFAFSARPADGSAGPDVYVWQTSDTQARPMTDDHGSLFAGWLGDQLLVSRVVDATPVTVLLDPVTGLDQAVSAARMWLPTVGPGTHRGVWWDGTLQPTADGYSWQPGEGELVLGAWSDGHDIQVLATGALHNWQVRWDETGSTLALWVSDGSDRLAGRLSLYKVDAQTGAVDLDHPLLSGAAATEGFSLQAGRLAWSVPVADGAGDGTSFAPAPTGAADGTSFAPASTRAADGATIEILVWSGDVVGHLVLPAARGAAVVR